MSAAVVIGCSNSETGDGAELALDQRHEGIQNGVRLKLAYDAASKSFNGTIKNTSNERLNRVRVEVHLSNGKKLGPTTPEDLRSGEERSVELSATSEAFERWSAHLEVGTGEKGKDGGQNKGK